MPRKTTLLGIAVFSVSLCGGLLSAQISSMPASGGPIGLGRPVGDGSVAPLPINDPQEMGLRNPTGNLAIDNSIAPAAPGGVGIGGPTYMEGLTATSPFAETRRPVGFPDGGDTPWTWQLLPAGIIYKSYLASTTEPRLSSAWNHLNGTGWIWNPTLGARVGLIRYGTENDNWPEGWQIDMEGAAIARLDTFANRDLMSTDYRAGVPITFRRGPWEWKFGYYHLSAHAGDEYLLSHPDFPRINYVRENLVTGLGIRPHPEWRLYGEVAYAVYIDGGAKPWEFQFGAEYSPAIPTTKWGAPFAAVNGHLNQATDFSGNVNTQLGWAWRGETGHLFRIGAEYFNGMSDQGQFFRQFENRTGLGVWYDF